MASDFTSDLKALCARLVSYNSEQEPLDDLKTLQNYIKELRTSDSEDNRNFLMGNLSGIAQFLLNNKKYSSDDSARIAADTVDEIISLFPLFFSSAKYLEAFRSCAEPMSYLYEQFLQDGRGGSWGVSPEEQEEMSQEWRRSISENMLIDAIKIDVQYDKKTWAKAKVIKIINNSDLSLAFENEGSDCFRTVSRDSHEIAPFNLKSWGDEWRWKLCKGSIVDVCDTVGIWYHSTIQDTKTTSGEHWTHIEVLVGYRVYEEGGEKCDHIGNFRGWSSKFDEWISAGSPRIMPHNTCARKTMVSQDKFNEEKIIDDSNDNIETSEWASFVTRTKKSDSILLVRSLNRAKASGLFQFFKDLIDKNDPWPSFDLIYSIVYYVGKAHSLFHKKFAKEFIPSFVEAIMKKLIDSPQATYRDFNKEKLDNVIYHLENLLKRVNSIEEKTEKIESFNLEISLKSFQTPYLERKIQGLRGISDAISRARFSKEVSNQSQELVSWVKQQDIISEVFGPKGHFQLVQRCGEVITLLSNSGDLTREQLEFIWTSAQKQDEDMRQSVYKMFAEINSSMRPEHLEVIVEFIEAIPPSKLQRDDITLVQEITKYAIRAEAAAKRACGFLWHAIIDNAGYSNSIIDLALETYTGLMKSWELRKNRKDVMVDCVQKIKENKSVTLAIQIIKNLLLSFPATSNNTDPTSKAEAIEFLVNEHNLLDVFFQNLVYFKEECLKKVENKKEDISNCVLFERVKYKEEIEERLSLLQTLVSGAFSITLTRSQMDTLWETFLKRALCAVEREHYLKWLADATESQSQGKKVFDDSDIYSFFIEKVANVEDNYKDMQFEGFGVFKSYFLLVNVSARKMQQTPKQNYMTSSSFYHSEYVRDFEYQVLVPPTSLEGMLCLRKIMIEVDSELVLSNASELFHELYDNVSYSQILETAKEIRSEFIEFALKYIQNGSPEVKKRSMLVLKNFMDECEKQGTPGLQPHGSMLKGDLHTLNFINQINYYPHPSDIQKKFELKVHSNTTIWELRNQVGQHVKCLNDQFKIYRTFSGKEVKDNENGKTLSEIRIRLNETFTLQKRYSKVPRIALLDDNEKLIPQARRIFSSWFNKFADKGDKMSPAGCAAFTSSCTGDTCQGTDKSIQDLFNIYDDDRDGFLTRENFLSFYERSCQNKLITVWSNLNSHFYRGDLRRYDDGEEPADIETLPGFIIMQNQENYELLFSALNVEELANPAWDLLIKLPTDPKVKEMIQTIPNDFDWNSFLDSNCFYKLLYNLQIIEFFMQDLQESNESLQVDGMNKKEWKIKFILTGGFKKLFNILIDFQKSEGIFQKKCLAFVLDLVGMFILAGFASMTPEIFEAVELVRKLSIEEVEGQESKTEKEDQEKGSKIINDLRDEIIKHNLQDHLIGIVDFSKLITKIMEIMAGILNCNESEVEDKHIVESALELWVTCLLHNSSLIESVYNFQGSMDLETLTFTALTHPKLFHVRSIFSKSLANICEKVIFESKMPIPYFLSLLMKKIPTDKQESDKDYSQFFEVFCKLLELDMSCPTQDYEKLIKKLMRAILLHPASEKRTSYLSDKVLVGLLSMAEIIFRYEERFKDLAYEAGFAGEVFMQILFPSLINFEGQKYSLQYVQETFQLLPPKAKCRDSRTAGYRLLSTLMAHHSKNLGVILDLVDELKNEISPVKSWNYSPLTDSRQNYVGIYNLGCICYMNAMLQQFFYVPQFRYSLLAVDDKKPPNPGPNDIDDNVIHQLQRMFGFLELSERQAYHPAAFCYSFKDFSGSPTNISIQQDAQEFLGVIFERLETALKDTDYKYLMQGVFGGKTVSQCICKVCGTVKENLEDFYNLSLDVKHSKTLSESLARFISGDSISDYQCDNCNKKVEITKRTLIEKVPNILIAHLQRIVFNFDTFANEKINTRLEFPMTVDLYPYTKAGLADPDSKSDDFTYDLVGIVVHKGTAEIGHYYSFIKTEPTKWFEFNDSVVKSFNTNRIEAECFGGSLDDDTHWMKNYKDNSRNAYMLVYEKKVKHSLKMQVLEGDSTASPRTEERDFDSYYRTMPDEVYQAVMSDNDRYLLQKNIYNQDFFIFLQELLKCAINSKVNISGTVISYVFGVLCRSFHNKILPDILSYLKSLFEMFPESSEAFVSDQLKDNLEMVSLLLLVCTEKTTREAMADFFAFCLNRQVEVDFSENSDVKVFVSHLLMLIPQDVAKHWTRFQQFWQFFRDFALGGESQSLFLLNQGVLGIFIDFYLYEKSPLARASDKRSAIGNKMWTPCYDPLIQTISVLISHCSTSSKQKGYNLTETDKKCLFCPAFYEKTLANSYDCKSLGRIVQYWSQDDLSYSESIAKILLKALNDRDLTDIQGLFEVISAFLTIEDKFVYHRIEWILGFPQISKIGSSEVPLPMFGSATISSIDEEVFSFPSTLELFNSWNSNDSILSLIWKYQKRWESYCLMYIKYLLRIFNLNQTLADWAKSLPPPTYQFASFLHWVEDFVHKNRGNNYSSSKDEEGEESLQSLLSLRENYGLRQGESFVVMRTVDKNLIEEKEVDDVLLRVIEYKTEFLISEPDGLVNKALPNKLLKSETVSYSVTIPYKTLENGDADTEEEVMEREEISDHPQEMTQTIFEVMNKNNYTIKVNVCFNRRDEQNFWCPASLVTVEVMPLTSKEVIILSKIRPTLPWPELLYRFEIENREYERMDEQFYDNGIQQYSDDVAVNVSDDDIRGTGIQVQCPNCTTFNDSSAVKCELCESPMSKADIN